jgi:hypothetical protein
VRFSTRGSFFRSASHLRVTGPCGHGSLPAHRSRAPGPRGPGAMALPVAACARHHQRRQRRASPRRSFVPAAVPIQPWLCPICSRMNGANLIPVGSVAKSCGCWPGPVGAGLVLRVLAWSCGCWPGPVDAGLVLWVRGSGRYHRAGAAADPGAADRLGEDLQRDGVQGERMLLWRGRTGIMRTIRGPEGPPNLTQWTRVTVACRIGGYRAPQPASRRWRVSSVVRLWVLCPPNLPRVRATVIACHFGGL